MGKKARIDRRLAEQAAIAEDLSDLTVRQYLTAGIEVQPVGIRTQFGPTQGVAVIFHMKNGESHQPAIIDVVGAMQLIAGISMIFAGTQGASPPEPPVGPDADSPAEATPTSAETTTTASGLILP
jgi:hypothetical protein